MMIVGTTRRSLLSAIKDPANRKAWDEFHKIYCSYIHCIARGSGLRRDEAEDVTSIVFAEIFQGKLKYDRTRGKFRSLLKTFVHRRAIDMLRKRRPHEERKIHRPSDDTGSTGTVTRIRDARTPHDVKLADQEWDEMLRQMALSAVQQQVSPTQFQIFSEHVLRGKSVAEVVSKLGVTPNQVYLAKRRVGLLYAKELKAAAHRLDHPVLPKPEKPNERE